VKGGGSARPLYGVPPHDPGTVAAVTGVLLAAALVVARIVPQEGEHRVHSIRDRYRDQHRRR
jgi:hypothetical protein